MDQDALAAFESVYKAGHARRPCIKETLIWRLTIHDWKMVPAHAPASHRIPELGDLKHLKLEVFDQRDHMSGAPETDSLKIRFHASVPVWPCEAFPLFARAESDADAPHDARHTYFINAEWMGFTGSHRESATAMG